MTQKTNTAALSTPSLGKVPVLTCAVLLTGMMTNGALAESGLASAQSQDNQPKPMGLGQVNYLKIPGYTSSATIYTRALTGQNNSIGTLNIHGIATVGYTLAAAPVLKKIDGNNTQFTDTTPEDGLPDGISYQWYRSCDTSAVGHAKFVPLADANVNGTTRTQSNITWCEIAGETGKEYKVVNADKNRQITVVVSYHATWGPESFSSTKNITGICPLYPNFNNPPPYACNVIFESSFE